MIICKLYYMNHACFLPKKVLNMKLKGKWDHNGNQRSGKMSHKRMWKENDFLLIIVW
jgi:hypothetical protein